MKEKVPVFVFMFNPLQTVVVAVLVYFVFGEKLYTGSILGGVTVSLAYTCCWGKEKAESYTKSQELPSTHSIEFTVANKEEIASALKVEP
ncbi:WAT1-related protein At5g13670-like [Hibiscus syriacus]|nr:WAT1-related protein At5g13670-like [Hibiscus syriacus]